MKVGLFFGSFNPIHIGHTLLANHMLEYTNLEQIWFVVSPQNPFKNKSSLLDEKHRLQLVKAAIGDHSKYKASDIEFKLPQPSYTITTLTYLKEKYPVHDFALIMGSDNLKSFPKWKNYKEILEHFHLYVYPRPNTDGGELKTHTKVTITTAPLIEISASAIRKGIKENKDLSYFLPKSTWEYIKEMHFYEK